MISQMRRRKTFVLSSAIRLTNVLIRKHRYFSREQCGSKRPHCRGTRGGYCRRERGATRGTTGPELFAEGNGNEGAVFLRAPPPHAGSPRASRAPRPNAEDRSTGLPRVVRDMQYA